MVFSGVCSDYSSVWFMHVLLFCLSLRRAQFMKGAEAGGGSGGGGGGGGGGNTYSRSLAEIQNHHNDSQEQLSPPPGPRSKHDEAYSGTVRDAADTVLCPPIVFTTNTTTATNTGTNNNAKC